MSKYLIIGLGNPGHKYSNTKHNIGFLSVDYFSQKNNYIFNSNIFNCEFYKFKNNNDEIFILKPQSFMNLSGECVLKFVKFYTIDIKNILVIHDDIDMVFGKIKLRERGSSGGQNGMKDIIQKFCTEDIKRIKIGIGRPNDKKYSISNYVLSEISKEENLKLDLVFKKTTKIIEFFYQQDFKKIISEYNND